MTVHKVDFLNYIRAKHGYEFASLCEERLKQKGAGLNFDQNVAVQVEQEILLETQAPQPSSCHVGFTSQNTPDTLNLEALRLALA